MAHAIRPYNYCKTIIAHPFPNTAKITWDMGKTASYIEKIMSDVEISTSDIIFSLGKLLENKCL